MSKQIDVILVDDNPTDVKLIYKFLSKSSNEQFSLTSFDRIGDAIDELTKNSYTVMLLDLCLPDGSGIRTLNKAHQVVPNMPIIIITNEEDDELAIKAVKSGAQDFIVKNTFDASMLYRSIRHAIERKRLWVKLAQTEKREHYLATRDVLTGLPNRHTYNERLKRGLSYCNRYGGKLAVMFMDLDRFKFINDTLGHKVGDILLKEVAKSIQTCLRDTDIVARLGGDEFIFLLPKIDQSLKAAKVAKHILKILSKPFMIEQQEIYISASIGIAMYPSDGDSAVKLIQNADLAMYSAKESGRNKYDFFTKKMNQVVTNRLRLENDMRAALKNDEFFLEYQPVIDTITKKMVGTEALIRWRHPKKGRLYPNDFISIAEETRQIIHIGNWVLEQACIQNKKWQNNSASKMRIAINVSAVQFTQANFVNKVRDILQQTGMDAHYLELELTEGILMQDIDLTFNVLSELRDIGVRISIDDFGTGYSSMSYLKRFPLDILKIDRSFIKDLPHDPIDSAIVTAIAAMARGLSLEIIAEGIENSEQNAFVKKVGCDCMQGFYLQKPVAASSISKLIKA
ncbi:diguanylate cyclase/phosphodiesterase (GGDEF & EAL domains) with PAS/PAC sensor(s) [hydrothermal vent metagenome]|uniref:Diguanylate cyclase/phosphodiesterase (GGDEF & EAL domains) with PAS/PAC sensor(S) n=1 Tax=hydrothermal vent metagenome TaxID=652676 RepID=A0A3B1AFC4_9ZZZZ